eukprot:3610868-Prymnesium_polylepis.1
MCQKSCGFCKEEDETNAKANNYKFVPAKLTRSQHVQQAKSLNCCLAMPTTKEKQQLIKAAAKGNSVWVGGILTAFDWQWEDGSDWKHQDWANGEPSFSNNNEHGIEMKVDGKWNDIDVNNKMSAVYQFQKGKYQKCIECAKQSKGFQYDGSNKECQSGVKSNDPKKCYKCTESEVDIDECTLTNEECASVNLVLDMIDPPKTEIATSDDFGRQRIRSRSTGTKYNRQEACRIGQGSLCWFREAAPGTGKYFGWQGIGEHGSARPVFEDLTQPGVLGKGYPTQAICEAEEGVSTCFEATGRGCKKDEEMLARCACEQYTDTPKYCSRNPGMYIMLPSSDASAEGKLGSTSVTGTPK